MYHELDATRRLYQLPSTAAKRMGSSPLVLQLTNGTHGTSGSAVINSQYIPQHTIWNISPRC